MSEILKPCPFCGGEARTASDAKGFLHWVYCPECGGQSGYFTGNADGIKKLAIDAWNTRAERTCTFEPESSGLLGQYKCSSCNDTVHVASLKVLKRLHYCPNCGARVDA